MPTNLLGSNFSLCYSNFMLNIYKVVVRRKDSAGIVIHYLTKIYLKNRFVDDILRLSNCYYQLFIEKL